ncbi:unnamed protein product [Rotaria socialis]
MPYFNSKNEPITLIVLSMSSQLYLLQLVKSGTEHATCINIATYFNYSPNILLEQTHHIWHVYLPDFEPGQIYAYRIDGRYDPCNGHRFNVNKLLIDPYTRAIIGTLEWDDSLFGYDIHDSSSGKDLKFNTVNSAAFMPKCVVIDSGNFNSGGDIPPNTPFHETIIYELHLKGFTKLNQKIPEEIRGTYAGIAHPKTIEYLKNIGITAVELMPVQHFITDRYLKERDLTNYWGSHTIGFFCIRCNEFGPSLSFKGIDNKSYYRLTEQDQRYCFDYTGTRNTLNCQLPYILRLIMDSLRYWICTSTVPGKFDLAATLARELHAVDRLSAFFDIIHQDPATAHDVFTLNDLVSYNEKHNEMNGENSLGSESRNRSWNCNVEGPTDDLNIN